MNDQIDIILSSIPTNITWFKQMTMLRSVDQLHDLMYYVMYRHSYVLVGKALYPLQKPASVAQLAETQCAPTVTVFRRSRGSIPRVGW